MSETEGFVFATRAAGKEPPDGGGKIQPDGGAKVKVSFKDMVMGNREIPAARPKIDLLQKKLATIVYEEDNPLKPMVHIADSVFEGLCARWQDALVIK